MKQSIIYKTLFILGALIIAIFLGFAYFFMENDTKLINNIKEYNLNSAMKALDARQASQLQLNKEQMQDIADTIAKNASIYLLNYDKEGLQENLKYNMNKPSVRAVEIFDSEMGELFLLALKDKNSIRFSTKLPKEFESFKQIQKPITFTNKKKSKEPIGTLTMYYDESGIIRHIEQLKSETKREIAHFNATIKEQLHQSNIIKFYMAIATLVAILAVISLLLIRFVNRPLQQLHAGLTSFFLFLQGKQDFTKKIEIDSEDEFGQMADSLNKNIEVSARLQEELHTLHHELEEKVKERTKALAEINKDMQDSIEYASVIQKSFLENSLLIEKQFDEAFVLWEPRDKVGGDLYVYEESDAGVLFGVIDCTGHSVPGGFMTMLAGSMVKSLANKYFDNPAKLLKKLNITIKKQLNQNREESLSDDGLDIGLCFINKEQTILRYAGAKLDLLYFKEGEEFLIKADKQSIGYKRSKEEYAYTNHEVSIDATHSFYLYSDGITDQTGGNKNFPLGNKKFKKFIATIQDQNMNTQKKSIVANLKNYQQDNRRRDDITVIGFKILKEVTHD